MDRARRSGRRRASRKTRPVVVALEAHLMHLTRAVTHIRLCALNDAKVAALDGAGG